MNRTTAIQQELYEQGRLVNPTDLIWTVWCKALAHAELQDFRAAIIEISEAEALCVAVEQSGVALPPQLRQELGKLRNSCEIGGEKSK